MEDKKNGVETKEGEQTPNQPAPTDTKKTDDTVVDQQPVVEEENVTISKKEFETLQKKADDFSKSIELKRLSKLAASGDTTTESDVNSKIQKLEEELQSFKVQSFNSSLSEAYRLFVAEHPWANDDAKFDKLKENFNSVGSETKEQLFAKLKTAAQTAFPAEYEMHLEERIKAKVLTDKSAINSNGSAGPATNLHTDTKEKTAEEKMQEKMAALYASHSKTRK